MKEEIMTQLYLCEEPYWSKYDQSDLYEHPIEINVISDGEYTNNIPCVPNYTVDYGVFFLSSTNLGCYLFDGIF